MNDSPYGLTAVDLDQDVDKPPSSSASSIETGTVFMNRCDYLDPALAWTGVKDTGRGASLSPTRLSHADPAEDPSICAMTI